MSKTKWSDLTVGQRRAICIGGAAELALTAAALWDLSRRPADRVRGSKKVWAAACFIQPVGPVAYFVKGRS